MVTALRASRRLAMPFVVACLVALAGLSLGRVYNGPLLVAFVAGAAAGAVLVSVALHRAPAWLVAPVSVGALAAYAVFAVNTSADAGGVDGDLATLTADAARNAVPRLLTAMIPVEPQPDTVLGPVVLAWLAAFAGAELAARANRPALGLLPPTLLYAGALVLVGPNAGTEIWQPLAFAGLAALGLAAAGGAAGARGLAGVAARERAALRLRTAVGVGTGVVAVLALVALTAPLVAHTVTRMPTDPRRYVQPPDLDVLDQNPLIRISGWAANPDQRLFDVAVLRGGERRAEAAPGASAASSVSASTPASGDEPVLAEPPDPDPSAAADDQDGAYDTRLRLAVLSDWDGVTWHVNTEYRNAGRVLPAPAPPPGAAVTAGNGEAPPLTIQERITVAELPGRLLPAVSSPRRLDGVRVAYDESTGTLLNAERLAPGLEYTVTSVNPSVDVNLLPAADVPSGPDVARFLAVGDSAPPDLSRLAEQIGAGEGSAYLRALALETFLSEHYRYASEAPSGHAYPNLRFFLFGNPRAGGQQGTSEQFAAAYAALGRLLGLPTRVVVGFRTPAGGGTVTGRDAVAWPEVLFDGVGWVAFDPMPDPKTPPRPLEDEFLPKPLPPTSPPASVEPPEQPTWSPPPPSASVAAAGPAGPGSGVIAGGVGAGILTLLGLFLLAVVVLHAAQQRRRLDRGSPPQRVLGAWSVVLDALKLAGATPPAHLAAAEVADHAAAVADGTPGRRHSRRPRPAAPPLGHLAAMVNAVSFGPPTGGDTAEAGEGAVGEAAAAEAKSKATGYAAALRARRSWWRRVLWRVDPRLLRRRPRRPRRPSFPPFPPFPSI